VVEMEAFSIGAAFHRSEFTWCRGFSRAVCGFQGDLDYIIARGRVILDIRITDFRYT
jgi:hypothetical protein